MSDRPITMQQQRYNNLQDAMKALVQHSFAKYQSRENTGGGFSNTAIDRWQIQNYEYNRGLR